MFDVTNLSRVAQLTFSAVDVADEMYDVVVAKAAYKLKPPASDGSASSFSLSFVEEESAVFVADEYFGALNTSSIRLESDLAPYKPKCDVIVIGSAHSPTGRPLKKIKVGISVDNKTHCVLHHTLLVHGARELIKRDAFDRGAATAVWLASFGSVDAPQWYIGEAENFVELPLRYETSFGGELIVAADSESADRVDAAYRLPSRFSARGLPGPVAHRTCRENPVGLGFLEDWFAKAARIGRFKAPRIEAAGFPLTPDMIDALVRGRRDCGSHPALSPQGFGVIAKSWQPRLKLAGTYDDVWRKTRWPNLPSDFDMGYWNGAHPAMQCAHIVGGEVVTLTNLLPHGTPGLRLASEDGLEASFALPNEDLALRLEMNDGSVVYAMMPIDTLTIDLEEMLVSLAWRLRVPPSLNVRQGDLLSLAESRERRAHKETPAGAI